MKQIIRLIAPLLCVALASGAADAAPATAHANNYHGVSVNDVSIGCLNEAGRTIYPIQCDGIVYIPLRTAAEWMGCTAAWDPAQRTVTLIGGKTTYYRNRYSPAAMPEYTETAEEQAQSIADHDFGVDVQLCPDIKVILDGVEQTFTDAAGGAVYSVELRGTVYLPVRGVAALCGKEIVWVPSCGFDESSIYIYDALTEAQKQELRTFYQSALDIVPKIKTDVQLLSDTEHTTAEAIDRLMALSAKCHSLRVLPVPSAPLFRTPFYDNVVYCGKQLETFVDAKISGLHYDWINMKNPWEKLYRPIFYGDHTSGAHLLLLNLDMTLTHIDAFLRAVGA